ncbi:copper homeostasis periplasmic binding protein CopC [Erythrobacter sp. 3-20A1M]|uniref:copper homeostasis periplasmic binding protein CopC n=1 Tax=Erythrobacter sp. 3-20A1M TaxID=2653850 RepID=UPI001C33B67F|nr:copper homeostasis periplasmic binding protein CopC [Erythrobacter sp. 3-20A1M]QWC57831.1 copper homeostasis periplasmic binding protein CopC [Erythrobacter sp. 3-20A1M]
MKKVSSAILGAIGAASLLIAGPAFAHAKLTSSNPADRATVSAAPKVISLTFNEELVPAFSKFEVTMPEHRMAVPVKTSVAQDGKTIVGTPARALPKGSYKIVWSAATADGHKMNGELSFKVG